MLQCIAKSEEGNRMYLELHGDLDRRLSYKVSFPWCYIRGCHCRRRLECMIISQEEHPEMEFAQVYIAITILLIR